MIKASTMSVRSRNYPVWQVFYKGQGAILVHEPWRPIHQKVALLAEREGGLRLPTATQALP